MKKKEILDKLRIIYNLYMKLSELEKEYKKNSEDYKEYLELLRKYVLISENQLKEISFDEIEKYSLISDFQIGGFDYVDVSVKEKDILEKRFIEHYYEIAAEELTFSENSFDDYFMLTINHDEYDLGNGIAVLREMEQNEIADNLEESMQDINDGIEENINNIKLQLYSSSLSMHTFMNYIQDEIDKSNNNRRRELLIDIKYRIIYLFRSLELKFLSNKGLTKNINTSKMLLENLFLKDNEYYDIFNTSQVTQICVLQKYIIERNKTYYENIDDIMMDLLYALIMKTSISLLYEDDIRNKIIYGNSFAIDMAKTVIDQVLLFESTKLNKDYIIPKK